MCFYIVFIVNIVNINENFQFNSKMKCSNHTCMNAIPAE